jgi:hypothetical protein
MRDTTRSNQVETIMAQHSRDPRFYENNLGTIMLALILAVMTLVCAMAW